MDVVHEAHLARILENRRRRGVLSIHRERSRSERPPAERAVSTATQTQQVMSQPRSTSPIKAPRAARSAVEAATETGRTNIERTAATASSSSIPLAAPPALSSAVPAAAAAPWRRSSSSAHRCTTPLAGTDANRWSSSPLVYSTSLRGSPSCVPALTYSQRASLPRWSTARTAVSSWRDRSPYWFEASLPPPPPPLQSPWLSAPYDERPRRSTYVTHAADRRRGSGAFDELPADRHERSTSSSRPERRAAASRAAPRHQRHQRRRASPFRFPSPRGDCAAVGGGGAGRAAVGSVVYTGGSAPSSRRASRGSQSPARVRPPPPSQPPRDGRCPAVLPDARTTIDLRTSLHVLSSGDWFYKWNSKGTEVHPRWVWADLRSYLLVWSRRETNDSAFSGSVRLESLCQVSPRELMQLDENGLPKTYYVLLIETSKRVLQLATERKDKMDVWFEALNNVMAYVHRHDALKRTMTPD